MPAKKYELWKKSLIEAWRAFLPAFLMVIFAQFEAGVDLKNWKAWVFSLLSSALAAGARAVIKYLREKYAKNYQSILYKLPV